MRITGRARAETTAETTSVTLNTRVTDAVEANGEALLRYFTRRVDQPEDAADLLAETLLAVWRKAKHLPTDTTEARMWMFGVARNVLTTHRRGHGRRLALAERLRTDMATRHHSARADGRAGSDADDLKDHVRALISDLDPRDQEIVTLVHWEQMSLAEVATLTGTRPSTVRSRYARARDRLRATLQTSGDLA